MPHLHLKRCAHAFEIEFYLKFVNLIVEVEIQLTLNCLMKTHANGEVCAALIKRISRKMRLTDEPAPAKTFPRAQNQDVANGSGYQGLAGIGVKHHW